MVQFDPPMNRLDIELLVRSAASTLSEALHLYWPAAGKNEIAERNISLHLAGSAQRSGFAVYGEGHSQGETSARYDLICLNAREQTLLVGECKRLFNQAGARSMKQDVERIRRFRLNERSDALQPELEVAQRFGVLAATTWQPEYAEWFISGNKQPDPSVDFYELFRAVGSRATWGACPIQYYKPRPGEPSSSPVTHWLVYVVFDLPRKQPRRG